MSDIDDLGARMRKNLTKLETIGLIELIQRTLLVRSESDFIALESAIKRFLDYQFFMCGFGDKTQFSREKRGPYLNVSYPEEFIEQYMKKGLVFQDHFVITALNAPGLHHSDDLIDTDSWQHTKAYSVSRSFGIREGYRSTITNAYAGMSSVFFFTASRLPHDKRNELILEILSPHLHETLCRLFSASRQARANPLSDREKEILQWISMGKSSWAVSIILSISEATVKFHIKNVMRKLDASSRTQAVASAIELGFISLDSFE